VNAQTLKAQVCNYLDQHRAKFETVARAIHARPELAFQEHFAQERLTGLLAEAGFTVERGIAGLPTSWRAAYGSSGPKVAILSEYDALPDIGHACGHNLIGTGGVAAAIALRAVWPEMPAQILSIGTPAEEDGGGKVLMVDRGVFADVDAAMMFHPSGLTNLVHRHALACQGLKIRFRGAPAHAAGSPWKGLNALDAMIQFFVNVSLMRQQILPDARMHGVITQGGKAANVIPEFTEASYLVRAKDAAYVGELMAKVKRCAEAGALATGCTVEFEMEPFYAHRLNNMVMARAFQANIESLGEVVSEPDPTGSVGSSDIGNVSLVCPAIHPYVRIATAEAAGHTAAFREASGSDLGYDQMFKAAKSMAMTVIDLIAVPQNLAAAKAEFAQAAK
jgi:amidohydrolase